MAAPIIYRSSDDSAPVLTGTAGDLVNLLDKCLVDGYGSKAGAGWTKPYTATNQRVYRPGGGNQFYLDIDDRLGSSVLSTATGKEAAVRGYETMSAVSTGTSLFPTAAQIALATGNWRKSSVASALFPRPWLLAADDRTMYLFIQDADTALVYKGYAFGDFYSYKTGDAYRTIIGVRGTVDSTTVNGTIATNPASAFNGTSTGQYTARIAAGTGTSVLTGIIGMGSTVLTTGDFLLGYDGQVYLSRYYITDQAAGPFLRGYLRGLFQVLTPIGMQDGDTFTGTGEFANRTFIIIKNYSTVSAAIAIETTAWDTSS